MNEPVAPAGAVNGETTTAAQVIFAPVSPPDTRTARAALQRQQQLTKPTGSLGRLEELAIWASACQNTCPPSVFSKPRVIVFAGDHGVAASGVSAYPAEVTRQMVENFITGGAAVNVLAEIVGATVRVIDICVDWDITNYPHISPTIAAHKIRRSSGNITVEDALTETEVYNAITAGRAIADEEIDSGADLLIAGDMGIGNTTAATVLIAALTNTEPVAAVGRGTGINDAGWIRKTAAIRDGLRRARRVVRDPVALLRTSSGADIAAMAGFCAQAAVRKTPVILDGLIVTAAAMVASDLAPGAKQWWQAGHRSTEPAHSLALTYLQLTPIVDLGMRLGEGTGALTALPIVQCAVATLGRMATFSEAGVSTQVTGTEAY
ncbi:MAG: nicotinate-nucleotide--dimethylbenzimidazole phosphoribosyltransferase [Mycobacteriaceae bacterium]